MGAYHKPRYRPLGRRSGGGLLRLLVAHRSSDRGPSVGSIGAAWPEYESRPVPGVSPTLGGWTYYVAIDAARHRIADGFARSNEQLGEISRKDFTAEVDVNDCE